MTFVVGVARLGLHTLGPFSEMGLQKQCGRSVRTPCGLALDHVVHSKGGPLAVSLPRHSPRMLNPGLGEFPIQGFVQGEFRRQGFVGSVEPPPQRGNGRLELEAHRRPRPMALAFGRQRWERFCGPCERGVSTFNFHVAHVCPGRVFPCRGELVHTSLRRPFGVDAMSGQRQPTRPQSGQLPSVRGHRPCQQGGW